MNRPVRVLFVTFSDLSGQKGNSIATKEIVRAVAENDDVELHLICPEPDSDIVPAISDNAFSIAHIPNLKPLTVSNGLRGQIHLTRTMSSVLNNRDIDLVLARMYSTFVAPPILAKLFKKPYFLLARGMSHRTLRYSSILKRIFWLNARIASQVYAAYGDVKEDADRMRKPKQPETKLFPNAVDPDLFPTQSISEARAKLDVNVTDDDFVIGSVSTLKDYHKVDELVRAVSSLNIENVKLLIVGDGPELENIRRLARETGINDQIIFTGFIYHEEVHNYISASDVLYGAVDEESPGNAIKCYEYLACTRPIITDRRPEFKFVEERELGVIVDKVNSNTIETAIAELYDLGNEVREKMGRRGRKYVLENHTWDSLVDDILVDYRDYDTRSVE